MSNGDPFAPVPPTTVTISDVVEHEIDPRARAKLEALGQKDAGWHGSFWAHCWASILNGAKKGVTEFASSLDEVMAFMGQFFILAQGEKNGSFYDLSATILGDLTGVEVDAEAMKTAATHGDRLKAMEIFGGDLFDLLQEEFQPTSGDLEEGDDAPAKRLLGFLLNFAIRQGNIETLVDFLPEEIRIGEGFRAYGELMAKNLGLGRIARRALQPLIQVLVADPLMYKLQEDFRPKRIGPTPAIKKFFRTPEFEPQMRKELGQEGYTDARINDLITDLRPELSERQLIDYLFRFGDVTTDIGGGTSLSIKGRLAQRGFSPEDVERQIRLQRPTLKESEIALLFINGSIDHELAITYLGKLGYDDDTAQLALRAHSFQHQHQRRLGLAELRHAFHNNVIDLLELKAHLTSQGYSDDDVQIITLDLLQPATGKVRQLSLAEIRAGFKAGVLTEQQAAEHLKTLGYTDADVAVIVKTLTPPKTPSTPAAPSGAPGTAA